MKKIYGQRWEFQVGNSLVIVDNAYDASGWGKERLIVNGETVQDSEGPDRCSQMYEEPWLTHDGEVEFVIKLKAGFSTVRCQAFVGDQEVACQSYYDATWTGHGDSWPAGNQWRKVEKGTRQRKSRGLFSK